MLATLAEIQIHQAAATLTAAVVGNLPDNLSPQLTPEGKLPNDLLTGNLLAWQVHKIFYNGIVAAVNSDDPEGWPAPKLDAGQLLETVAPLLGTLGIGPDVLGKLLPLLLGKIIPQTSAAPTVAPPATLKP